MTQRLSVQISDRAYQLVLDNSTLKTRGEFVDRVILNWQSYETARGVDPDLIMHTLNDVVAKLRELEARLDALEEKTNRR